MFYQDEIDRCKSAIDEEEKAQWMATSWETLIQAKKENVALQLEAAYRQRLQEAFSQVTF
jgi:F-type H+-transporting ATPase subunit b